MTLIKSISGIRGTIGGIPGENLTPPDIIAFTSGFAAQLNKKFSKPKVFVGRDGRDSGAMVQSLVNACLVSIGVHVLDAGLSTTPSIAMAIINHKAHGGIMITASHNPMNWNALKFMNEKGEFVDHETGSEILELAASQLIYHSHHKLGKIKESGNIINEHIQSILNLPLVNSSLIKEKKYKIVLDAINSTGAISIPPLLEKLGVEYKVINGEMSGVFNHNPEPLPEHIVDIQNAVIVEQADLGIIVDPDVDRLAFVCENGSAFGEEYTLVAIAEYILKHKNGNTVSNLSSTLALRDITVEHGAKYFPAAVGEVNVVAKMKEVHAVIGGEGNGGIIYPDLHYGRDALVGIALFLSHLAEKSTTASILRSALPNYEMSKNKIELTDASLVDKILDQVKEEYKIFDINTMDGVKINMQNEWIHLRKSNTEPIIRIYSESLSKAKADDLANNMIHTINKIIKSYHG